MPGPWMQVLLLWFIHQAASSFAGIPPGNVDIEIHFTKIYFKKETPSYIWGRVQTYTGLHYYVLGQMSIHLPSSSVLKPGDSGALMGQRAPKRTPRKWGVIGVLLCSNPKKTNSGKWTEVSSYYKLELERIYQFLSQRWDLPKTQMLIWCGRCCPTNNWGSTSRRDEINQNEEFTMDAERQPMNDGNGCVEKCGMPGMLYSDITHWWQFWWMIRNCQDLF